MDNAPTVYVYDEQSNIPPKLDYIFRFKEGSDSSSYEVQLVGETKIFAYNLRDLIQENMVLKSSFKNLWNTHLYNQEYIGYLLGTLSKEDFKQIAETYAEPLEKEIDGNQLLITTSIVCSVLNQKLSTDDLSLFLNVTPSYLENSLKLLDYTPTECDIE